MSLRLALGLIAAALALGAVAYPRTAPPAAERALNAPAARTTPWPRRGHVRSLAYFGLNDVNAAVPAQYMAAHVDMVEDDGFTAQHADAFKRAGGETALAYTDPTFVPHCVPPFVPPAGHCEGPIGERLDRAEDAWVHDARGERLHHFYGPRYQYQEALNPGSASARLAYARTTAAILAASPRLDGFFADDSGSNFTRDDGIPGSNIYWNFGRQADIAGDAAWIAGERAMLAAAGKPVIVNGGDRAGMGPAYDGAIIDQPFVMGQMFEGCFNNVGYLFTSADRKFERLENGLMAVERHRKLAVCLQNGDTSPAHRLYAYAAFLLSYDPRWSVFAMAEPQADGFALYPESEFVPLAPRATARSIEELRRDGVYAREFAECAIAGVSVGPCAAVVNASPAASAKLPRLAAPYAHRVELDERSSYRGGQARVSGWSGEVLPPATGAILVR